MAMALESNKAKIAKRVIEVLEFFDQSRPKATVMDIVRRYDRPQSSTSELLASLVQMGLLYKDPMSRSYSPTPRLATLGTSAQPEIIRDSRLFSFMDHLAASTRYGVALFGMVGTHAQIFRWSAGSEAQTLDIQSGASETLSATTAGLLLLSTLGSKQAGRVLWRLNAEASTEQKFNPGEVGAQINAWRVQGYASGVAGFVPNARVTAMILPRPNAERPLALGLIYPDSAVIDTDALLSTMKRGFADWAAADDADTPVTQTHSLVRSVGSRGMGMAAGR